MKSRLSISILEFALKNKYSTFYKEKFPKDVSKLKSFEQLPFLTRSEIVATPASQRLFVPEKEVVSWSISSGTTGSSTPLVIPKIVHNDDEGFNVIADLLKRSQASKVLVLRPQGYVNTRVRLWCYHKYLSKLPFIFGNIGNLSLAARTASQIGIDAIDTTSSTFNFFLPFLKEEYDLSKIKIIFFGGEFTSAQKLKLFIKYFPKAFFHFRFVSSESPVTIGFQCQYMSKLAPRFLHPDNNFYLYEVIDSEGDPVKEGGKGELVLTSLKRSAFPLIRYKTGDMIVKHPFECKCGRKGLIELFGRIGYDLIKIGGVTVRLDMLDQALSKSGISEKDYCLHIYEDIYKNQLIPKLVLELPRSIKIDSTLSKRVEKNLYLARKLTLKHLIKQNIFLPLEIKTGKLDRKDKAVRIISHIDN